MNARVRTYSPREVATHFGLNLETVQRCLKRGELQGVRTGRRGHYWHIPETALESWMENMGKRVLARSLAWNRRRTAQPPSTTSSPGTSDPTTAIQGKPRKRKNKP